MSQKQKVLKIVAFVRLVLYTSGHPVPGFITIVFTLFMIYVFTFEVLD